MIFRGAFWTGLVWLSMLHAPHAGPAAAPLPCRESGCADPIGALSDGLRSAVFQRLAVLKTELNGLQTARQRGVSVGASRGEAVFRKADRLADAGRSLTP